MPKRSDGQTATLEAPRLTPAELAAAATEKSESIRREAVLADWRTWREIAESIASGQEPDGKQLALVATLAARLRLPAGALAATVSAISRDRALAADIESREKELAEITKRTPTLSEEIKAAKQRWEELLVEERRGLYAPTALAGVLRSRDELRESCPEAFASLEELVERRSK